jgi:pilus assembly protein Flp/PilA
MRSFERFWRDESAATAIEYSLIATLISLAIIGSFSLLADQVQWLWSDNNSKIVQALDGK